MMKELKRKEKKEILIIDKGVDIDDVEHNTAFCCRGAFMPFR